MEYKDKIVYSQRQKTRLSFKVDKNLVNAVNENLKMIGLDQSNFLTGFLTNIANSKKLPFEVLNQDEQQKARLSAELSSLNAKWDDIPELSNKKELESWLEEKDD